MDGIIRVYDFWPKVMRTKAGDDPCRWLPPCQKARVPGGDERKVSMARGKLRQVRRENDRQAAAK